MEKDRNFNLAAYQKASQGMIATNESTLSAQYKNYYNLFHQEKKYDTSEIISIVQSGSLEQQQKLSRHYFSTDGYYKQIIIHYATLLKYAGLLIPNPGFGKNLSNSAYKKRYYQAIDYLEQMKLPQNCAHFAWRALVDGCYYGVKADLGKKGFQVIDLPAGYAVTRFKDFAGNDIIEFNLRYFYTIEDLKLRNEILNSYPSEISKAFRKLEKGKITNSWYRIPANLGVCFPFFDGRPLFLSVIPATTSYDMVLETEKKKSADEIRKILVQHIPSLSDGRLVFEPEEAEEMHQGAVQMMKGNDNTSVLTTYGQVSSISSETSAMGIEQMLSRYEQNIYSQAGVTGQILSGQGSSSFDASLRNDTALMMYFANKVASFITQTINELFSKGDLDFKFIFLPITNQNDTSYAESSSKLMGSGFSALIPAVAQGLTQKDLVNLKSLENDVLNLSKVLKPLSQIQKEESSQQLQQQQTPGLKEDNRGRPALAQDEKSEKTLRNEASKDSTGSGGYEN